MDYDFIVGFTLFCPTGYKTMYRHFNKLETAELFASNRDIKDNCKIYVDYLYYKKLERKIKARINYLLKRYDGEEDFCSYDVLISILKSLLEKE